jgi:hypothetical protein
MKNDSEKPYVKFKGETHEKMQDQDHQKRGQMYPTENLWSASDWIS